MGHWPKDPSSKQPCVVVNADYALSIARIALFHIKKYRKPYAVLRYGREYVVRRCVNGHIPEHWETLPWYRLVGVYDQHANPDFIAEDIIVAHRNDG